MKKMMGMKSGKMTGPTPSNYGGKMAKGGKGDGASKPVGGVKKANGKRGC